MDIKVSNTEKSKNNIEKCMKGGPLTLFRIGATLNRIKVIYKRYIIWSKSFVNIKVSNTEISKNNLEKRMKVGPHTLYA